MIYAVSGITMDETAARQALRAALGERAEAQTRAAKFAEQLADATKALDVNEAVFIEASAAHDVAVASRDDGKVLRAFHKVSEAKALWAAGKKVANQTAEKLEHARLQCDELA